MTSALYRWLLVGWVFLTGVGEVGAQTYVTDAKPLDPSAVAYTISMNVLDDKRLLKIGDRLSMRVLEERKAPFSLMVTDSGEVEVPLIGRIQAKDKTCKSLAYAIKSPMERDYY